MDRLIRSFDYNCMDGMAGLDRMKTPQAEAACGRDCRKFEVILSILSTLSSCHPVEPLVSLFVTHVNALGLDAERLGHAWSRRRLLAGSRSRWRRARDALDDSGHGGWRLRPPPSSSNQL